MSAIGPKPFNVDAEYAKLNAFPKIIITIAYYATMIFTLGTCTATVYEFLVRKFSVLDLSEDTEQAKSARKADEVAHSLKSSSQPDTRDHIEHLENEFWEWMYSSKTITTFQLVASANKDQPKYITDLFLDQFFNQRQAEIIEPKQKMALAASIETNITKALKDEFVLELEEANVTLEKVLIDKRVIQIFSTGSDGSCGMHAISGVQINGKYLCDAQIERARFIDWIRVNDKVPRAILNDYFKNINESPKGFKDHPAVKEKYHALHQDYENLPPAARDKRADDFAMSPEVKEAYLENLANPGVYLLQDELTLYAEYKKVNLILFQKGWGNDQDKIMYEEINTPEAERTVGVYYNGVDHYSYAKFKTE